MPTCLYCTIFLCYPATTAFGSKKTKDTMTTISTTKTHLKHVLLVLLLAIFLVPGFANAQDCPGEPDSNELLMNYSLYYEAFKNKDYQTALPYLKWILSCSPGFTGKPPGDDRNFKRAVDLYQGLSDNVEDASLKRAYLDTSLVLFEEAVSTLQDAGAQVDEHEWLFEKGRFIQKNVDVLDDLQGEVGTLYRQVYDGNVDLLSPTPYYVNVIVTDLARNDMKEDAVSFMEDVESKFSEDTEVMKVVDTWRGQLFKDPVERMAFLEEQLEKNPGDLEIIEELIEIYKDLEERDKLSGMIAEMLSLSPSPKLHLEAGIMKLNDGDVNGSIDEFNLALNMEGGDEIAKEINFNLGAALRQQGKLSQARRYYRQAVRLDPQFSQVYAEIGALYAEAVRDCGGAKMDREDRAVYWLVADYYERAGNSRTAAQYKPYFPTAEDLFFKGWNVGDEYSVDYGCYSWINEKTKVRNP